MMKVFISYCDIDGLNYAQQASVILRRHKYQSWYFDGDKTVGIPRIDDITQHIRNWCDIVLYICTENSVFSEGQRKEIVQWDNTSKQLMVIWIDKSKVPESIDGYIYKRIRSERFEEEFNSFVANELEKHHRQWVEYHNIFKRPGSLEESIRKNR